MSPKRKYKVKVKKPKIEFLEFPGVTKKQRTIL